MNKKYLSFGAIMLSSLIIFLSCKSDKKDVSRKTADSIEMLEATQFEIFNVEPTESQELKKTTLKYKDVKYHRGDLLVRQDFYQVNNTLKAFEVITKDGDKGISNYYSTDSTLLAIYHLVYHPNSDLIMRREGYDGQTKELLRVETYEYDTKYKEIKSKVIYDATGSPVRKFNMSFDAQGNEKSVTVLNQDGSVVAGESFEVIARDNKGRWTERWGSLNGQVDNFQRRIFTKTNK